MSNFEDLLIEEFDQRKETARMVAYTLAEKGDESASDIVRIIENFMTAYEEMDKIHGLEEAQSFSVLFGLLIKSRPWHVALKDAKEIVTAIAEM